MEFHIARALREKLDVDDRLFNYVGNVIFGSLSASRKLAKKINDSRQANNASATPVHAGALFAMGLIDELSHAMVARYRETLDPAVLPEALRWFEADGSAAEVKKLLLTFAEDFPNTDVYRGKLTAAQWLEGIDESSGLTNREAELEELLLLWMANTNPAFSPFKELFDDTDLQQKTIYNRVTSGFEEYFATRPAFGPNGATLLDVLRAPLLASPDSLTGQLAFMQEKWSEHLGPELRQILLAIDVMKEEDLAVWMMFHPPSADAMQRRGQGNQQTGWAAEGFVGDEFIGFAGAAGRSPEQPPPLNEYEAFSPDYAWMPTVVLIAKSTYVWLEQLSKKYGRHIYRLDHIPSEELALLADRGINALWLIGLWERSTASQTIKRLRGQPDAVASAYSLKDYRIAEDLGGTAAYENLRDRAARAGIRLASDMVPNHMGIDSTWVIEHPEWFLSRQDSPYPVYSFEGPDVSTDSRVEIKIEDHYYEQTDAAVVFRLRERSNGKTEYIYHGNDGTTFAWNDTAQLDYLKADVREHVIQTILSVAKLFPIIRFDAAMTLAKKHVQRLWFPLPGMGGSIPSRAEYAMSQAEFDAMMPEEFWREVVDRAAIEAPGTLLLAEAFWLLEGYFVRTLGMHRVYNSAFMNMLRDEENAKYRSYLKKTIEFDPDILKRYVNFMSNPDEKTAIDQFGTGDKYFGACTLLATLPGLPMFGHGQIEGFTEKYGMEYKQARFNEYPNEGMVARHQHEIAPLLKNRRNFAESSNFVLYDFWTPNGTVDENVFAYSNRLDANRSIVLFNNVYGSTHGTIHISAESMDKYTGQLRQRSLSHALGLPSADGIFLAYKDTATHLEYLLRSTDVDRDGFTISLRGYQYAVLQDWRELQASEDHPWDQLFEALHGAGVYSLVDALTKLRLQPLHDALRQALSPQIVHGIAMIATEQLALAATITQATTTEELAPQKPATELEPAATTNGSVPLKTEGSSLTHDGLDPRIAAFLLRADVFLQKAIQIEDRSSKTKAPVEPADTAAVAAVEAEEASSETEVEAIDPEETAIVEAEPEIEAPVAAAEETSQQATLQAAVRLPQLKPVSAAAWPPQAKTVIPAGKLDDHPDGVWAPILASIFLRQLSPEGDKALELFDQLQIRSALAEIFSGFGIEGEDSWRAAARTRILVSQPPADALQSEAFWSDPDVRWLGGVNTSEGRTYFNKEQLEEVFWWLQLPNLLKAAGHDPLDPAAIEEIEEALSLITDKAEKAGYDLSKYLEEWQKEPVAEIVADEVVPLEPVVKI